MKLSIILRENLKKIKEHRKSGKTPGVVYGKYMHNNINVLFDKNAFLKIYKEVGKSRPFDISSEDKKIDEMVLVHDFQVHPVTDSLLHVDFLAIKKGEKVVTEVSVILTGRSIVEKNNLGNIQLVKNKISIEALPKDLPKEILLDISLLKEVHDVLFVKDLVLPKGVVAKDAEDTALVTVIGLSTETEEETTDDEAEVETTTEENK